MKDFHLEASKNTLEIICTQNEIKLEGNSILPNPESFFRPLMNWASEYILTDPEKVNFSLKFAYIDTASVQTVFNVLSLFKKLEDYQNRVYVKWYFEFDDPELLEIGEIMEGRLNFKFDFIEYVQ